MKINKEQADKISKFYEMNVEKSNFSKEYQEGYRDGSEMVLKALGIEYKID